MMKKTVKKVITLPGGRIETQYSDGTSEVTTPDLPQPLQKENQIEQWKKDPKAQALKEACDLSRSDLDPAEKRVQLDIIRFKAEIQGAQAPASHGGNVIMIQINQPGVPERRVVDVEAKEKKN